jgi:hypothetical protein
MIEVLVVLAIPVGIVTLLAYFEPRREGPRYSGKVYDPSPRPVRRAGAVRVGMTGRMCEFCQISTFGYSSRCGRCHRLPVHLPIAPVESTVHPLPLDAESSSLIAVAAAPHSASK